MKKILISFITLLILCGCSNSKNNEEQNIVSKEKEEEIKPWIIDIKDIGNIEEIELAIPTAYKLDSDDNTLLNYDMKKAYGNFKPGGLFVKKDGLYYFYDDNLNQVTEEGRKLAGRGSVNSDIPFATYSCDDNGNIYCGTDSAYRIDKNSTLSIGFFSPAYMEGLGIKHYFYLSNGTIVNDENEEVISPKEYFDREKNESVDVNGIYFTSQPNFISKDRHLDADAVHGIIYIESDGSVKVYNLPDTQTDSNISTIYNVSDGIVTEYRRDRAYFTPISMEYYDFDRNLIGEYEYGTNFYEGYAAVKKDGKWGYIDKSGNVVVDFLFDCASEVFDGCSYVVYQGKIGKVNLAGLLNKYGKIDKKVLGLEDSNAEAGTSTEQTSTDSGIIKVKVGGDSSTSDTQSEFPCQIRIIANNLKIRSGPGTSYEHISKVVKDQTYTAYEKATGNGYTWYRIGDNQWIPDQNGEWITKQ